MREVKASSYRVQSRANRFILQATGRREGLETRLVIQASRRPAGLHVRHFVLSVVLNCTAFSTHQACRRLNAPLTYSCRYAWACGLFSADWIATHELQWHKQWFPLHCLCKWVASLRAGCIAHSHACLPRTLVVRLITLLLHIKVAAQEVYFSYTRIGDLQKAQLFWKRIKGECQMSQKQDVTIH